ncbi:hypothetical protein GYA19_01690 [Candidatus Beckwithbacteria bacterium]|nr:hypothetical protein [Candidatus Beckwithbacteria bacterium]
MDQKALKLCARFALTPNQLGYCGTSKASKILQDCILNNTCAEVEVEIKKFIILNPYLQTIAQITKKPPFSYEVIEAYWLGNDSLKECQRTDFNLLLENFNKQGVPSFLIQELKEKLPKVFIPIHLFNILHVGVGRTSGAVPFNLNSINNCMLRWGKILTINNQTKKLKTKLHSLKLSSTGNYILTQKEEKLHFDPRFTPNLKIGDRVIAHWGFTAKKITKKEEENLQFWTKKLITSF